MVFLRKITLGEHNYYYLFHTVSKPTFKKYKRYVGMTEPTKDKLKQFETKFLADIQQWPELFSTKKNVISLLQDIQSKKGFVPEEEIVKICKELDIPATDVYGVLTFYSQFKLTPPGKYKISICRGTACHVKNSDVLQKYLEEALNIKAGETTKDTKFSLECVNCIGACARAPAMMINGTVYGELTKDKIKQILSEFK
jgi:iron-hydrogenase subunit gamma